MRHGEISLEKMPDYISFDFCRNKKRTAPRGSGGVSVCVKQELVRDVIVQRIFENISDCFILILNGQHFQCVNDIILVFTYPRNTRPVYDLNNDNGIELLSYNLEQVITHFPEAQLLLAGNFNS